MAASAVTPIGVRDGDPDALAGLCDVRGPAVLAYCEVIAGRGPAGATAAADAFGSFRAGVVATADLANFNPEAMLISATRHAAARYAGDGLPSPCSRVPSLLAARADRSITLADHDFLEQHLAGCWTCRAPVARFEAADRAYLDPPDTRMDPAVASAIVAAMTAAAPVRGSTVDVPAIPSPSEHGAYADTPVSTNGYGAHAEPAANAEPAAPSEPAPAHAVEALDQPTSAYELPAEDVAAEADAGSVARRARRERPRRRATRPGALSSGDEGAAAAGAPPPTDGPPPKRPRRSIRVGGAVTTAAAARPSAGTSLPRPSRAAGSGAGARGSRPALRLAIVLPIVLVVFAIVAALAIAGVFGGDDPPSAPQSFAPSAAEPDTTTATTPVVVVPSARDASAADVERAKARARAAKRKAAAAKDTAPAATAGPSTAAATTPPAAATTPPPPPPPPPATKAKPTGKGSAGAPAIDADNGATGAEQVPAPDTSTVPELAPPVESLDPP